MSETPRIEDLPIKEQRAEVARRLNEITAWLLKRREEDVSNDWARGWIWTDDAATLVRDATWPASTPDR